MQEATISTIPAKAPAKKVPAGDVKQQQLVVQLPEETVMALKLAAVKEQTTVRVKLLQALEAAGFPVPAGQAVDFRKVSR